MSPDLVKSALVSAGIHLSILAPFFGTGMAAAPPQVDLAAGMSSVELEWVEPSVEPAESAGRPTAPAEEWVQDAGVLRAFAAPGAVANPSPLYPRVARQQGWEGTVIVQAWVDPSGAVASAQVNRSSGHTILDDAALAAVQQWRFRPARRNRQAVASRVEIPITFRLKRQTEQ